MDHGIMVFLSSFRLPVLQSRKQRITNLMQSARIKLHIGLGLSVLAAAAPGGRSPGTMSPELKRDVTSVLSYLDQLLEALPEEKIREFAQSEYFETYKRLFDELGLGA